jgi:asparagine synthase (glutamine-hydrolysing)
MCGIFLCVKKTQPLSEHYYSNSEFKIFMEAFDLLNNRGPDYSRLRNEDCKLFGFKRLAINDLTPDGNQPFFLPHKEEEEYTQLSMCNGEIYNHKFLEEKYKIKTQSQSDCECLIPLYKLFTFSQTNIEKKLDKLFNEIDGVFALSIYDKERDLLILARDRIGVKPLFYTDNDEYFIVSSEAKTIDYILTHHPYFQQSSQSIRPTINQFSPRSFGIYDLKTHSFKIQEYFNMNLFLLPETDIHINECLKDVCNTFKLKLNSHIYKVYELLTKSIEKRLMSDRPVGTLLSGGLDSSIVASVLSKIYRQHGKKIKTFSIGFPDSTDLKYARVVADYIGSEHHEYIINYDDALKTIPDVIKTIETYDITTIRASTPMYMLCKWIKDYFSETVIFSGEGSDELFGGYLYFHNTQDSHEFHRETIRLLSNLHKYDVLRADRCTSGNSLELREPFLDKDLIEYIAGIDGKYKMPQDNYEKYILRKAFTGYLPDCVLWRRKATFSDAVSGSEKPWYKYIQEHADNFITNDELNLANQNNQNELDYTKESLWYLKSFKQLFPCYDLKVDIWMPKWSSTTDPSASTLEFFKKDEHN